MEFIELSVKDLEKENKKLYKKIDKEYKYDLVVFIASGSYLIGKDLAKFNDVPLIEVRATRDGGKLKKFVSPILKIIPSKMKLFLRKKELNSNYHKNNSDRRISFDESIWKKYKKCKKILLVDDSVDTGHSMKFAKKAVQEYYSNSQVVTAAYNIFDAAKEIIDIDYKLYENAILKGPWSNDSNEHSIHEKQYNEWKRSDK